MDDKEIVKRITKGEIHAIVLFEIVGHPKEHIEKTIKLMVEHIQKEDKTITWLNKEIGEAEETPDKLWSTFCEAEILVKDMKSLSWLSTSFAPASIEIIEPEEIKIKDKELTDFFGDVLSQIHVNNTKTVELGAENKALIKNINAILRNAILITLSQGPHTSEEISKQIGLTQKDLKPVFNAMIQEKRIVFKENKYFRVIHNK